MFAPQLKRFVRRRIIGQEDDARCPPEPRRNALTIEEGIPLPIVPLASSHSDSDGDSRSKDYTFLVEASEVSIPSMGIRYVTRLYNNSLPGDENDVDDPEYSFYIYFPSYC